MSDQGIYIYPTVHCDGRAYTAINISSITPAYGDIVVGYVRDMNFYIQGRLEDNQDIKYLNPLNNYGIDTNNDLVDEDRYITNGDMIFGLFYDFAMLRASEGANIIAFRNENLLRLVGLNLQVFTAAYSLASIGNSLVLKMFNEDKASENIKIFGSRDGDNVHVVVQDPTTFAGLADVHISSNGNVNINTTTSVSIKKKSKIKNPVAKKIVLEPKETKQNFVLNLAHPEGYNLSDSNEEAADEHDNITNLINNGYEFNEETQNAYEDAIFKVRDDGSIILKSSGGAFLELTSTGKARISAPDGVLVDSGNEAAILSKNIDLRAKDDIGITSDSENISLYAKKQIVQKAKKLQQAANIQIKSEDPLLIYSAEEILIESKRVTVKTKPASLLLDGLLINDATYNIVRTSPPSAAIVSIGGPTVPPVTSLDADVNLDIDFAFDNKFRNKNNTLYEAGWMKNKPQKWVLGNITVNSESPYPGQDVDIIGYNEGTDEFVAGSWNIDG